MELFVGVQNGFAGQANHSHRLIIAPTIAMTRLLIAILAATTTSAFKTPKSRALKVRGGIDIQKLGTALIGLEGIVLRDDLGAKRSYSVEHLRQSVGPVEEWHPQLPVRGHSLGGSSVATRRLPPD